MKKTKKIPKLTLNKLNVSNLQRIVGGKQDYCTVKGVDCNSTTQQCNSINTQFTEVVSCCSSCFN